MPHSLKLRILFLSLSLALFLAACGSPTATVAPTAVRTPIVSVTLVSPSATPALSATATAPAAVATAAGAASATPVSSGVRIGYVFSTTSNASVVGAITAAPGFGMPVQLDTGDPAQRVAVLVNLGMQVIVTDGADLADATRAAAIAFPKVYFINLLPLGQSGQPSQGDKLPNLLSLGAGAAREDQLGFLDGVAAGYATQAKIVTAVGYVTDATGLSYRNGFLHGVRLSCSRCRVDFVDLSDLSDGATAAAKAKLNASLSSDVVFAAAGAATAPALQAAAAAGAWVAGADNDIYTTIFGGGATAGADKVLASAYFDPGTAVTAALKAYSAGTPWTGPMPYSAATGALVLAPFHVSTDVLSDLDRSDIQATIAQLADGSLDTGIDLTTGNEQ
jgi:basic membrane lipoprotein Med (substrate-binding protein (PBP1-ABC) superfamily)